MDIVSNTFIASYVLLAKEKMQVKDMRIFETFTQK